MTFLIQLIISYLIWPDSFFFSFLSYQWKFSEHNEVSFRKIGSQWKQRCELMARTNLKCDSARWLDRFAWQTPAKHDWSTPRHNSQLLHSQATEWVSNVFGINDALKKLRHKKFCTFVSCGVSIFDVVPSWKDCRVGFVKNRTQHSAMQCSAGQWNVSARDFFLSFCNDMSWVDVRIRGVINLHGIRHNNICVVLAILALTRIDKLPNQHRDGQHFHAMVNSKLRIPICTTRLFAFEKKRNHLTKSIQIKYLN